MKRLFVVIMMIFALSSITSSAKGIPDYYVIDGEDMFPMILHLDVALIFDPESRITPAPEIDTAPYILHSYVRLETDELYEIELSPVAYYPEEGIIYFLGAAERGIYQPYDHKWYVVNSDIAAELNLYIEAGRDLHALPHTILPALLSLVAP